MPIGGTGNRVSIDLELTVIAEDVFLPAWDQTIYGGRISGTWRESIQLLQYTRKNPGVCTDLWNVLKCLIVHQDDRSGASIGD